MMGGMAQPQTTVTPIAQVGSDVWGLGKRIAFRFAFTYVALYTFPFPYSSPYKAPWLHTLWVTVAPWVGAHVLHTTIKPASGDLGDAAEEYVRILVLLTLAVFAAALWSIADRNRPNYERLHQWLRVYVRLFLGAEMVGYGMAKVWPVQFPLPRLSMLSMPFGDMAPFDVLWNTMGSSRIYTLFAGLTEVLSGVLLFIPRVATAGALLSAAALTNVLFLNLGYNVNVKQYSLHLLLMAGLLLGPDLRGLAGLLIFHRPVSPIPSKSLFRRPWLNHAALILQLAYGGYLTTREFTDGHREVRQFEETTRTTPFYGMWSVDELRIDGEVLPALVTEDHRWWRVIFEPDPYDAKPDLVVQMTSGVSRSFYADFDKRSTLVKLKAVDDDRLWFPERFRGQPPAPVIATLKLNSATPERLQMEGDFEGRVVQATLRRMEVKFVLQNCGFHWVNDRPCWTRQ
jgi:hypothetical protein